jgi:histidinol-phosphate aminotransferase
MPARITPVRDEVRQIAPYNAGLTLGEVRQRFSPERIAKLGSNESPLGPSASVRDVLNGFFDNVKLYPDPQGRELGDALAVAAGISADRIILGNGSEDLLSVICRTVLRPGDSMVTLYPSFPLHEDYATIMGARVERVNVLADLTIDVDTLVAALEAKPRMAMFANPMNPVGSWLDPAEMARVIEACSSETVLVIDEAYAEYAAGDDYPSAAVLLEGSGKSWITLRTFSKAFGLAGLRIGYGIASDPELRAFLDRVRTPFNTNGPAQSAALAALQDHSHLAEVISLAITERKRVRAALEQRGYFVAPSKGNFLFFDSRQNAGMVSERLLHHGVIVKPWKQAGYETYVRVSIGSAEENDQFLDALVAVTTPA